MGRTLDRSSIARVAQGFLLRKAIGVIDGARIIGSHTTIVPRHFREHWKSNSIFRNYANAVASRARGKGTSPRRVAGGRALLGAPRRRGERMIDERIIGWTVFGILLCSWFVWVRRARMVYRQKKELAGEAQTPLPWWFRHLYFPLATTLLYIPVVASWLYWGRPRWSMTALVLTVACNISSAIVGGMLIKRWLLPPTTKPQPSRRILIMNFIIINLWIAMIWVAIIRGYLNETPASSPIAWELPPVLPPDSELMQSWKAQIAAHLGRNKRFPEEARFRGEEGVAHVFFSLDRQGRLRESRVVQSSGVVSLDEEALALLRRSEPYPPPPPEWPREYVDFNVPIRFNLHPLTPLPPPFYR